MTADVAASLAPMSWDWDRAETESGAELDGVAWDMPESDYFADPWFVATGVRSASSSVLKGLLPPSTPQHAHHGMTHPRHSDAFDFGSAVHKDVLSKGAALVVVDADSWRTKAAREAKRDARAAGLTPVLVDDMPRVKAAGDAVRGNADVQALLAQPGVDTEVVLTWREPDDTEGTPCRAMLDIWTPPAPGRVPVLGDLKTIEKTDDRSIADNVARYGYHVQRAHYCLAYYRVHGVWPAWVFVFVEKDPPHAVRVVELDDLAERIGGEQHARALTIWRECIRTDIWPGRPAGVGLIGLPGWARREWED